MTKNNILEYVYNNKMLNEAIYNVVGKDNYDDFKSHLILQVAEKTDIKLIGLYDRNELDWFCLKIITSQYKSKTSRWYKMYKNMGMPTTEIQINTIDATFYAKSFTMFKNPDRKFDFYDYNKYDYDDYIPYELPDYDEVEELYPEDIIKRIKELLEIQYKDLLVNQYHKTLFILYHFKGLKLREIEKLTNINFRSISRSINKTETYIKSNITI